MSYNGAVARTITWRPRDATLRERILASVARVNTSASAWIEDACERKLADEAAADPKVPHGRA